MPSRVGGLEAGLGLETGLETNFDGLVLGLGSPCLGLGAFGLGKFARDLPRPVSKQAKLCLNECAIVLEIAAFHASAVLAAWKQCGFRVSSNSLK